MTKQRCMVLLTFITLFLAACGGGAPAAPTEPPPTPTPSGDKVAGEQAFLASCSSCHGADARGLPGVGKDLVASEFTTEISDDELLTFIKNGRPTGDPANTTGIDMPPKGGNPAITDQQILDIIAFLRSIHE